MLRPGTTAAAALGLLLLAGGADPAAGDLYRWTDESGVVHFTGDPNQVPARYRDQAAEPAGGGRSSVNFVSSDEQKAAAQAREERLQRLPRNDVRAPSSGASPGSTPRVVPRQPARRMDAFAEEKPKPAPQAPQKYTRDCDGYVHSGRCRSWVNPEWKRWKQDQDAQKASGRDDDEL